MNIAEILQQHAADYPAEVALIDRHRGRSRETTYAGLEQAVGRTVTFFKRAGLQAGDTALLFHTMSAELYITFAALLRLGMQAMFVDPSAGRHHIDRCCALLPPQAFIASSKAHYLRMVSPAIRRIPHKISIDGPVPFAHSLERASRLEADSEILSCSLDRPALVTFSSGSTGRPKAAVRTHGFLRAQHRAIEQSLSLTPGENELATLPIFVLANLASRVTSVIADADLRRPDEINPRPVIEQIRRHAVTRAAAPPAFFERLTDDCEQRDMRLPTLRNVFTGGGPVSLEILDRLQRIAPQASITAVYGATEAEPISILRLDEIDDDDRLAMRSGQGLLAGHPVPSINIRIIEDRWGRPLATMSGDELDSLTRSPGTAGEIVVSGAHVLSQYLHGQGEDENKFRVDGTVWHRTGDAGFVDDRGRLWLLGRCEARIDDDDGSLYPLGLEQAALQNRSIDRAAVVAHEGRRVLAISLRDKSGPADLESIQRMLSFASVDSVRVLNQLPVDKRHNSKTDYAALHALLKE